MRRLCVDGGFLNDGSLLLGDETTIPVITRYLLADATDDRMLFFEVWLLAAPCGIVIGLCRFCSTDDFHCKYTGHIHWRLPSPGIKTKGLDCHSMTLKKATEQVLVDQRHIVLRYTDCYQLDFRGLEAALLAALGGPSRLKKRVSAGTRAGLSDEVLFYTFERFPWAVENSCVLRKKESRERSLWIKWEGLGLVMLMHANEYEIVIINDHQIMR